MIPTQAVRVTSEHLRTNMINTKKCKPLSEEAMKVIKSHRCRYRTNKAKIDADVANIENIYEIRELLKIKRIAGYKLNHALEEIVQNNTSFHMFIEFSEDCRFIKIINRKPLSITQPGNLPKWPSEAKLKKLTKQ
jgi:hypothetical protein